MKDDEIFDQFYFKLSSIVNSSFNIGEQIFSSKIVWKILSSLLERFQAKVTAIEKSRDIDALKVEDLVESLQTFEANFRQPRKVKGITLISSKEKNNEEDDSDSNMDIEEMALFVKKFIFFWNKRQQNQSSSLEKTKGKSFDKIKFVRKSIDKSSKKQCFEYHGFGHIATNCPNKKKTKGSKVLTVTWSDLEKEEESDNDDESENFTVFMTSALR